MTVQLLGEEHGELFHTTRTAAGDDELQRWKVRSVIAERPHSSVAEDSDKISASATDAEVIQHIVVGEFVQVWIVDKSRHRVRTSQLHRRRDYC